MLWRPATRRKNANFSGSLAHITGIVGTVYWGGVVDENKIMGKVSAVAVSFSSERQGLSRIAVAVR